ARQPMTLDNDKIDRAVLALLYLGLHDVARAWKGFDWEAMNRLHEKGFISDPRGKRSPLPLPRKGSSKHDDCCRNSFRSTTHADSCANSGFRFEDRETIGTNRKPDGSDRRPATAIWLHLESACSFRIREMCALRHE